MLLQAAGFAVLAALSPTAPGPTTRKLTAFNALLRARGRILLMLALLVAGAILAVDGLLGLIGRT
jgi:hypothetical protein